MKLTVLLAVLGTIALVIALAILPGCSTGAHSVCYDGKCVNWTNTPPAAATNAP